MECVKCESREKWTHIGEQNKMEADISESRKSGKKHTISNEAEIIISNNLTPGAVGAYWIRVTRERKTNNL